MRNTQLLVGCTVVALLLLVTGTAMAETPAKYAPGDTLKVDYFSNANTSGAPDATVHIINPGTTYATICADIVAACIVGGAPIVSVRSGPRNRARM